MGGGGSRGLPLSAPGRTVGVCAVCWRLWVMRPGTPWGGSVILWTSLFILRQGLEVLQDPPKWTEHGTMSGPSCSFLRCPAAASAV